VGVVVVYSVKLKRRDWLFNWELRWLLRVWADFLELWFIED
jgi:hypothetical protein